MPVRDGPSTLSRGWIDSGDGTKAGSLRRLTEWAMKDTAVHSLSGSPDAEMPAEGRQRRRVQRASLARMRLSPSLG